MAHHEFDDARLQPGRRAQPFGSTARERTTPFCAHRGVQLPRVCGADAAGEKARAAYQGALISDHHLLEHGRYSHSRQIRATRGGCARQCKAIRSCAGLSMTV
jgi:hypothetical protein